MEIDRLNPSELTALDEVAGYLNFSAGASDRQFLANLNQLYRVIFDGLPASRPVPPPEPWNELASLLRARLAQLEIEVETFRDASEARAVIELVHDHVLAAYRQFHRDLLFHQDDAGLFGPFFLGRVYEVALQQRARDGGQGRPPTVLAAEIVGRLNDFIGHRPVATLETQKIEPYAHEWHRPVPLFIRGAGAAVGRYEALVARAVEILESTDPRLLEDFHFDPQLMDELALDARAYDFDHPVNKRPNYQFGEWDPHHLDNQGRYRRFVVRQITLDALQARLEQPSDLSADELLFEAAAALAGTVLMSCELSGSGPATHSSEVTLGSLLPGIAAHRDRFYEGLLAGPVPSRERLQSEAESRRQPFGGVRQHLNAELARQRAMQLEHVQLARLYARMGQPSAALRQAESVPTARSRIVCQIQCHLSTAQLALDGGQVTDAAGLLGEIADLMHRGVECGAIVDPWNILGFDANFSLFPALENSVPDHRISELLELMDQIFALFARTWTLAAAGDDAATQRRVADEMARLAAWWDQFAAATVSGVDAAAAGPLVDAAWSAAAALSAWHRGGTTTGDVAFWQPHADEFDSPKAFVLVIDALLDKGDYVASMALLMHWLSHAQRVELQAGSDWFHIVAGRWLCQLLDGEAANGVAAKHSRPFQGGTKGVSSVESVRSSEPAPHPASSRKGEESKLADRWRLVTRFFDFLEANAEEYWQVPHLELDRLLGTPDVVPADEPEEPDDDTELFSAAYDGMVYRDSTDDDVDSSLLGSGPTATDYELEQEAKRISNRLAFLVTLARLWRRGAEWLSFSGNPSESDMEQLSQWLAQVLDNRERLIELLAAVAGHRIPQSGGSVESALEYERRRWTKDTLTERIISACVTCAETAQSLLAAGAREASDRLATHQQSAAEVLRAALAGDIAAVRAEWPRLLAHLEGQPLLYVPLAKGGDPERIVAARSLQRTLRLLLGVLPRLGLILETAELLRRTAEMERSQTVLAGAVTEFDELLKIANQGLAECLVVSGAVWPRPPAEAEDFDAADAELIGFLEDLAQAMLVEWLSHSRTLRLSVLEKVAAEPQWQELVKFIREFGGDLFIQHFLNLANLRAILHRGIVSWLAEIETGGDYEGVRLIDALQSETAPASALAMFQLVLEAIAENYTEYRDFNSTTTQSDRGELIYMLLDLLRLRVQYDRIDWNVAPVAQIHEVLVRHGRVTAAELWRQELAARTEEIADQLLARLDALQREYGLRLPTVADRLRERFVRPLAIDRARALIRPAIDELRTGGLSPAFAQLEQEVDELSREPTGVGLDVPAWLEALQEEADEARWSDVRRGLSDDTPLSIPQRRLTREEIETQLDRMREQGEKK